MDRLLVDEYALTKACKVYHDVKRQWADMTIRKCVEAYLEHANKHLDVVASGEDKARERINPGSIPGPAPNNPTQNPVCYHVWELDVDFPPTDFLGSINYNEKCSKCGIIEPRSKA